MGCLKAIFYQIGCLIFLVALAVGGFVYRRQIWDYYEEWRGTKAPVVAFAGPTADGAREAEAALERLARRGGPAYVDLTAAQVASLLDAQLARAPRRAFDSVSVFLGENDVKVRGSVDLTDVPPSALGPLRGAIGGRQRVTVGGPLAADSAGRVLWQVTSLRIGEVPLPRGAIGAVLKAVHVPGLEDARVPLPLQGAVGDVRVGPAQVRLYRK